MRFLLCGLFILLTLAGCENPLGPDLPANAREVEPHEVFDDYWAQVEKDAGVTGDFSSVRWYRVDGGPWEYAPGKKARGMWIKSGNRILIADPYWTDFRVVAHEMLHALLQDPTHNHPLFSTDWYQATR